MAGKYSWIKFKDISLQDGFFDSLKRDYEEFPVWFAKKSDDNSEALVFEDEVGIGAFLYLKNENEPIELKDKTLPDINRTKIGTLKLDERFRGQRLGEGTVGVALWNWQKSENDEIYVTVFEKHKSLVGLLKNFGFKKAGENNRGESVYLKNRYELDYSDPKKSFPFIDPSFKKAGILPIDESYHDKLLPYSDLMGHSKKKVEEITAGNGITKVYIAFPYKEVVYDVGCPIFIYRKSNEKPKTYKSVITSFGVVTEIREIKKKGNKLVPFTDFSKLVGNKSVFKDNDLKDWYESRDNLVVLEFIYNGYFGAGNNVTHNELKKNGLFETYPYSIEYDSDEFKSILKMGKIDYNNVIIN